MAAVMTPRGTAMAMVLPVDLADLASSVGCATGVGAVVPKTVEGAAALAVDGLATSGILELGLLGALDAGVGACTQRFCAQL